MLKQYLCTPLFYLLLMSIVAEVLSKFDNVPDFFRIVPFVVIFVLYDPDFGDLLWRYCRT